MKTNKTLHIESPYPALFTLLPDEVQLVTEMHHAWNDHLCECDTLTTTAVEKRHAAAHADVRKKRCAESLAAFRALPPLETDKERSRQLAEMIREELDRKYRTEWRPKVVEACQRIAGEIRKWLAGYGEEMRPRFEALGLNFAPILSGEPYTLSTGIIHALEVFAASPQDGFTQLPDVLHLIVEGGKEAA
jgi:hypothetical protein